MRRPAERCPANDVEKALAPVSGGVACNDVEHLGPRLDPDIGVRLEVVYQPGSVGAPPFEATPT
jgi:hypothetical protein